eukprot:GHVU01072091.1.p1 GENE.GHVU01072091.1~~GHVU01072091.1.p1  ORF type:complete len:397 (-),score=69.55 GHVU01072091.1:277-1467(-)
MRLCETFSDNSGQDPTTRCWMHSLAKYVFASGNMTPPLLSDEFDNEGFDIVDMSDFEGSFVDGNNPSGKPRETGYWTMVYDEGFHVETENNMYFAFMKYTLDEKNPNKAKSYCTMTLVGWWRQKHDTNPYEPVNRGCWWGEKVMHKNKEVPNHEEEATLVDRHRVSPIAMKAPESEMEAPDIAKAVEVVTDSAKSISYKRFKNVKDVDIWGKSFNNASDLLKAMGAELLQPRLPTPFTQQEFASVSDPKFLKKIRTSYLAPKHGKKKEAWQMIRSFAWNNPEDVYPRLGVKKSVVPQTVSQSNCGSCYALAAEIAMTSRMRIKFHTYDDIVAQNVSGGQARDCAVYNQGCKGGYGFLTYKFGYEHGFVTKKCEDDFLTQRKKRGMEAGSGGDSSVI